MPPTSGTKPGSVSVGSGSPGSGIMPSVSPKLMWSRQADLLLSFCFFLLPPVSQSCSQQLLKPQHRLFCYKPNTGRSLQIPQHLHSCPHKGWVGAGAINTRVEVFRKKKYEKGSEEVPYFCCRLLLWSDSFQFPACSSSQLSLQLLILCSHEHFQLAGKADIGDKQY